MPPSRRVMHRRRVRRYKFYPTDPGPQFCWLCGSPLDSYTMLKDFIPGIAFEKEEWASAWRRHMAIPERRRRKFTIYVKASDLSVTLQDPVRWRSFFRMIVFSKDDKYLPQGYHISGIGYMPGARTTEEKYLLVPRDPGAAYVGAGRENFKTLHVSPVPHPFRDSLYTLHEHRLEGYVLHARCWDLAERQIGTLACSRLDLVVTALQKQWNNILPQLKGGGFWDFREYQEWGHDKIWDNATLTDPLFIPEVDTLLQDSAQFLKDEASNESRLPLHLLTVKYNLPLEIQYLIADYLNNKDTYNMLVAFGEQFPLDYWKRQVPTDVLFELKRADPGTIHWPHIAWELENKDLLGTSAGLWHRKRIQNMLVPVTQYILGADHNDREPELSSPACDRLVECV